MRSLYNVRRALIFVMHRQNPQPRKSFFLFNRFSMFEHSHAQIVSQSYADSSPPPYLVVSGCHFDITIEKEQYYDINISLLSRHQVLQVVQLKVSRCYQNISEIREMAQVVVKGRKKYLFSQNLRTPYTSTMIRIKTREAIANYLTGIFH